MMNIDELIKQLEHEDWRLRKDALKALSQHLHQSEVFMSFCSVVAHEEEHEIRDLAIDFLEEHHKKTSKMKSEGNHEADGETS